MEKLFALAGLAALLFAAIALPGCIGPGESQKKASVAMERLTKESTMEITVSTEDLDAQNVPEKERYANVYDSENESEFYSSPIGADGKISIDLPPGSYRIEVPGQTRIWVKSTAK